MSECQDYATLQHCIKFEGRLVEEIACSELHSKEMRLSLKGARFRQRLAPCVTGKVLLAANSVGWSVNVHHSAHSMHELHAFSRSRSFRS